MTKRNVIRNREIVQDDWDYLGAEDAIPQGGKVIVELARWKEDRTALLEGNLLKRHRICFHHCRRNSVAGWRQRRLDHPA